MKVKFLESTRTFLEYIDSDRIGFGILILKWIVFYTLLDIGIDYLLKVI